MLPVSLPGQHAMPRKSKPEKKKAMREAKPSWQEATRAHKQLASRLDLKF